MTTSFQDVQYAFYSQQAGRMVDANRLAFAGTGPTPLSIAAAGNFRATLKNTHTRPIKVVSVRGMVIGASGFMGFFLEPTEGLPTATPTRSNSAVLLSSNTLPGEMRADTNTLTALSGGTNLDVHLGFGNGERSSSELPGLVVQPNATLGMNLNVNASATGAFTVFWVLG